MIITKYTSCSKGVYCEIGCNSGMRCWEKYFLHVRTILDEKYVAVSDPSMKILLEGEDYDEILALVSIFPIIKSMLS